jgi:carboxymethylenebutenolidase
LGTQVTLTASDGFKLGAYRADPAGKTKGALVVIQEIFGVNHHIRAVCDGFAAHGYSAIGPQVFDRYEKNFETGYTPDDIAKARAIIPKINWPNLLSDVQAAIDAVKSVGKVGIVGYCLGGSVAFIGAAKLHGLTAAVGYYGGQIAANVGEKPKIPTMLLFGDKDQHIPPADIDKVRKAHPDIEIHVYPADHGFNCDERGSYDAPSAKAALERTLAYFGKHLAS